MSRILLYLIPLAAVIGVFSYQHYLINSMTEDLKDLSAENAKISLTLDRTIEGQKIFRKNFDEYKINVEDTNKQFGIYRDEVSALEKKLSKHNLTKLIKAKPKMMEKIINKGTAKVFKEIENETNHDE